MKKENIRDFCVAIGFLAAFALWTLLLGIVDVQAIGPCGSAVGFGAVNGFVHKLTGVHMTLYHMTDWLGLVPVAICVGFAVFGLVQWIKRKNILKVDHDILVLGVFYLAVMGAYLLFEEVVVNYRPVLIKGFLEVSYPSSTTLLVMCAMPTAAMQLKGRIKNKVLNKFVLAAVWLFVAFMVTGRLVSGVHWVSDIAGGALLSAGLVMMYRWAVILQKNRK